MTTQTVNVYSTGKLENLRPKMVHSSKGPCAINEDSHSYHSIRYGSISVVKLSDNAQNKAVLHSLLLLDRQNALHFFSSKDENSLVLLNFCNSWQSFINSHYC